jgi:putative ABC transport system substrate-binding protein
MDRVMRLSRRAVVGGLAGVGVSAAGLVLVSGCSGLPFAAQPQVKRIGRLWSGSEENAYLSAAWRDGLRDAGWIEGHNLVFEERTYRDHPERIPDLAAELVALQPDVLTAGATDVALALKRATHSIPIVFAALADAVANGLIASYARPGGNVTGTSRDGIGPKLLDLLRQLVPGLERVAVMYELREPSFVNDWRAIQTAAQTIGVEALGVALDIASAEDLEDTLEAGLSSRPQALIVSVNSGTIIPGTNQPALPAVTSFAMQQGLPTASRVVPKPIGGLLYYGPDVPALYRRAGSFHVDRVLRGAKPADLPVEGPTVFELVVNRTTATALGITIPPDVAAQVTEWVS